MQHLSILRKAPALHSSALTGSNRDLPTGATRYPHNGCSRMNRAKNSSMVARRGARAQKQTPAHATITPLQISLPCQVSKTLARSRLCACLVLSCAACGAVPCCGGGDGNRRSRMSRANAACRVHGGGSWSGGSDGRVAAVYRSLSRYLSQHCGAGRSCAVAGRLHKEEGAWRQEVQRVSGGGRRHQPW